MKKKSYRTNMREQPPSAITASVGKGGPAACSVLRGSLLYS